MDIYQPSLKDRILNNIIAIYKQIDFNSEGQRNEEVVELRRFWIFSFCQLLDRWLLHGLIRISPGYWPLVTKFTDGTTVKRIKSLNSVSTNLGRGRAWLYMALTDCLLLSYLRCLMENRKSTRRFYSDDALILDSLRMKRLFEILEEISAQDVTLDTAQVNYLDLSCIPPELDKKYGHLSSELLSSLSSSHNSTAELLRNETQSSAPDPGKSSPPHSYVETSPEYCFVSPSKLDTSSADFTVIRNRPVSSTDSPSASRSGLSWTEGETNAAQPQNNPMTSPNAVLPVTSTVKGFLQSDRAVKLRSKMKVSLGDFKGSVAAKGSVLKSKIKETAGKAAVKFDNFVEFTEDITFRSDQNMDVPGKDVIEQETSETTIAEIALDASQTDILATEELPPLLNTSPLLDEISELRVTHDAENNNTEADNCVTNSPVISSHLNDNIECSSKDSGVLVTDLSDSSSPESRPKDDLAARISEKENDLLSHILLNPFDLPSEAYPPLGSSAPHSTSSHSFFELAKGNDDSRKTHSAVGCDLPTFDGLESISERRNRSPTINDSSLETSLEASPLKASRSYSELVKNTRRLSENLATSELLHVASHSEPSENFLGVDQAQKYHSVFQNEASTKSSESLHSDSGSGLVIGSFYSKSKRLSPEDIVYQNELSSSGNQETPAVRDNTESTPHSNCSSSRESSFEILQLENDPEISWSYADTDSICSEIILENNCKLLLMAAVMDDNESFVKIYRVSIGHTDGFAEYTTLLITDCRLMLLSVANMEPFYIVEEVVNYADIDFLSISLGSQILHIHCKRRRRFHLAIGCERVTKHIAMDISNALQSGPLQLPPVSILPDATAQKIAVKKHLAEECRSNRENIDLFGYYLIHWEVINVDTTAESLAAHKEGHLLYSHKKRNSIVTWKRAYFILRNGILYQYPERHLYAVPENSWTMDPSSCKGCRKSKQELRGFDRECVIELLYKKNQKLLLCAANTAEASSWKQSLCFAMLQGKKARSSYSCMACSLLFNDHKLLLCHEDLDTGFLRTIGSCDIHSIVALHIDPDCRTYCLLEFDEFESDCELWAIHFNASAETLRFISAFSALWMKLFQVPITTKTVHDEALFKQCRQTFQYLKNRSGCPLLSTEQ